MNFNFKKVATFLKYRMDMPHFIFDPFEKELLNIQKELLKKVATKYSLNYDELLNDLLPKEVKLIPNTKTSIQIKKNNNPITPPSQQDRCMARVWNRGKGGQCLRNRIEDKDGTILEYCSQHKNNRKHGRIDELPNNKIFPKESKSLYK